jgi:hypothetical protein
MALSAAEYSRLRKACSKLENGPDYRVNDYVTNLNNTVLDFQMKSPVVGAALKYFKKTHKIRTHFELRRLIDSFPSTKDGNRNLARVLWNNGHWTRAAFLRELLRCLEKRGVTGACHSEQCRLHVQ